MNTILKGLSQFVAHWKVIILFILMTLFAFFCFSTSLSLFFIYCVMISFAFIFYLIYRRVKRLGVQIKYIKLFKQISRNRGLEIQHREGLKYLRQQIKKSHRFIYQSKLLTKKSCQSKYELPWYVVIGSSSAGKSSALKHSGLTFLDTGGMQEHVSDQTQATAYCEWLICRDGVLLDTAGRYTTSIADQPEWLGFLRLLKKNRPEIPINGLVIMVSITELLHHDAVGETQLVKRLNSRIQQVTEYLEISMPIYLIFTQMDLIEGFTPFFKYDEVYERDQVWGATLSYATRSSPSIGELFEQHFQVLSEGLQYVSRKHYNRNSLADISINAMSFPLEFSALKPILSAFVRALFDDHLSQSQRAFRGFYFTSALQEGVSESPITRKLVQEFDLEKTSDKVLVNTNINSFPKQGYFLKELFSHVIFKDRKIVKPQLNIMTKRKRCWGSILVLFSILVCMLLWLWSYKNNQQLIEEVQSDLDKAMLLKHNAEFDLGKYVDVLLILQRRLQQLDEYERHRPFKLSFGLYQGKQLKKRLKAEYLNGIKQLILLPAQQNMAQYLQQLNNKKDQLSIGKQQVVAEDVGEENNDQHQSIAVGSHDAYYVLKAYLMLSKPEHVEVELLNNQVAHFWYLWLETYGYDQDKQLQISQKVQLLLNYSLSLAQDELFPVLQDNPQLVDQSRQNLLSVIHGISLIDRIYNEIKQRAAVRFATISIDQIVGQENTDTITGDYILPGIFTQKAWGEYIANAIEDAVQHPIEIKDWVFNHTESHDLSFTGSPEQIRQQLTQLYKQEYALEWKKLLAKVRYVKATNLTEQIKQIDRLSDPNHSPIRILLDRVVKETHWDNPSIQAELLNENKDFISWFKTKVLLKENHKVMQQPNIEKQVLISQQFDAFYHVVRKRNEQNNHSLLDEYLNSLLLVRHKLNTLKHANGVTSNALLLVQDTINDKNTVLNATEKIVGEKILIGIKKTEQEILQSLFLNPLTQVFETLLPSAEEELNKLWVIQVYQPFTQKLALKFPFNRSVTIQASASEIAEIFGETGRVSKYLVETLEPVVIRHGGSLNIKTWHNIGIHLNPQFSVALPNYLAPIEGMVKVDVAEKTMMELPSNFQLYPLANSKLLSYIVEIDGQRMVFEKGIQQWSSFIWPNKGAILGVRITAIDLDGKSYVVFEASGEDGINQLFDAAVQIKKDHHIEMTWTNKQNPELAITVAFRVPSGIRNHVGVKQEYIGLKLVDWVTTPTVVTDNE